MTSVSGNAMSWGTYLEVNSEFQELEETGDLCLAPQSNTKCLYDFGHYPHMENEPSVPGS